MNITQRLAMLVLAVAIPMLLLSAATGWRLAEQTRERSQQAMIYTSRPIMNAVDAQLGRYMAAIQVLAVSPSLKSHNFTSFREEAEQALPNMPGAWVTLADAQGRQLVNTSLSTNELLLLPVDKTFVDAFPRESKMRISNLRSATAASAPMISVALRLGVDEADPFILSVNAEPAVFRGLLNSQVLPDGWLAEIVDGQGTVIARSVDHDKWVGRAAFVHPQCSEPGETQFEAFDPDGTAMVGTEIESPLSDWCTVIAAEKTVVDAPIHQVTMNTLFLSFVATIVSLSMGSFGARLIARPIGMLERGANALQNHEPILLSPTGVPEFDRALIAFETASKSIIKHRDEQSQVEAALKLSESRLRLFIEQAPASIAIFDRDRCCLAASHRFLHQHGLPDGHDLGTADYELLPETDHRWEERHRRALAGEVLMGDDEEFLRADGELRWISWEIRPWRSPDGGFGGIALFTEDVSLRHEATAALNKAVEALRDSEERLRLLIDGAKDYAIFMLDPNGEIVSWNNGAGRTMGYAADEIIGHHFSEFFTEADIATEVPQRALAEACSSGAVQQEGECLRKGGDKMWVSRQVSPLLSEAGSLRGYAVIFRDITESRLAEQAIKTSETLLRAVVDGSPDAIIAINPAGTIQSVNRHTMEMFGYDRQELVGRNIQILVPGHYGDHDAPMRRAFALGQTKVINMGRELEGLRKDGTVFPIGIYVTKTEYADSPLYVGFLRDLSGRREIEARLKELQGERLSAMGGLAAGLAHELNQPLAAAATFLETAQLLLDMPPDERPTPLEDKVSGAINEIMRAGQIMKRLRQFVTTGEPDKTFANLHDLILDPALLSLPRKQQINIDLELASVSDAILADQVQIKQVLANLIKNATEAMHGSPVRTLKITTKLALHDMIQVDVSDTGGGVSNDILLSLFEPFQTTKASGMGIGLSISRMIVEAHYGEIWASCNLDGGAIFSFTLPLVKAELFDEQADGSSH